MEDLLIVTFVLVDDWYKSEAYHKPLIGKRAEMTDSEVLTLILAMDFLELFKEILRYFLVVPFCSGRYPRITLALVLQ